MTQIGLAKDYKDKGGLKEALDTNKILVINAWYYTKIYPYKNNRQVYRE